MNIQDLRILYQKDLIFMTEHVINRCRQRNIKPQDIRNAIDYGIIIEDYPDDYPYPSCLILGLTISQKSLHVVVGSNGQLANVITAYYPDPDKWDHELKTRKAE